MHQLSPLLSPYNILLPTRGNWQWLDTRYTDWPCFWRGVNNWFLFQPKSHCHTWWSIWRIRQYGILSFPSPAISCHILDINLTWYYLLLEILQGTVVVTANINSYYCSQSNTSTEASPDIYHNVMLMMTLHVRPWNANWQKIAIVSTLLINILHTYNYGTTSRR